MDWAGLMQAGIVGLGLKPWEFWRLTPVELALMLGIGAAPRAMTRAGFEDLLRRWPDGPVPGPVPGSAADDTNGGGNGGSERD